MIKLGITLLRAFSLILEVIENKGRVDPTDLGGLAALYFIRLQVEASISFQVGMCYREGPTVASRGTHRNSRKNCSYLYRETNCPNTPIWRSAAKLLEHMCWNCSF